MVGGSHCPVYKALLFSIFRGENLIFFRYSLKIFAELFFFAFEHFCLFSTVKLSKFFAVSWEARISGEAAKITIVSWLHLLMTAFWKWWLSSTRSKWPPPDSSTCSIIALPNVIKWRSLCWAMNPYRSKVSQKINYFLTKPRKSVFEKQTFPQKLENWSKYKVFFPKNIKFVQNTKFFFSLKIHLRQIV